MKPVLLVVLLVVSLCACGADSGIEGGACYGNNTCDDGFECVSGVCKAEVDGAVSDGMMSDVGIPDVGIPDLSTTKPLILSISPASAMANIPQVIRAKTKNVWDAYKKINYNKDSVQFYFDGLLMKVNLSIKQKDRLDFEIPTCPYGNKDSTIVFYFKFGEQFTNQMQFKYLRNPAVK